MREQHGNGLERIVANLVERVERRFYGKYRGLVVDNADPAHLGRLRVRVPSVLGPDVVTGWATACVPYGGAAGEGVLFVPDKDAGVWVEFEEGDLEFPIWVGTYWSQPGGTSELPAPATADGADGTAPQDPPTCKVIRTKAGHTIQFEDAADNAAITVVDGAHQHVVRLDKDGITIREKGGNAILLTADGIRIGKGATEALVLGTTLDTNLKQLINDLNMHTHLGNLGAPTSPPSKPATLDVPLSKKHTVN
jgi:hypothetical protein